MCIINNSIQGNLLNETGKFYVTFDPIDGSTVIAFSEFG
jgi:hypothetical protein